MFASWAELVEHLRKTAPEVSAAQVAAPPGRPWVALTIPIGPVFAVGVRAALVANSELPIGALATSGTQLVLRQTLPLDGLAPAQLDQAARTMTELAAALRAPDSPYAYLFR